MSARTLPPVSPEQRLASHQDGGPALANFVRSFELNSNITPHRRLLRSLGLKAQGLPRSAPGTPHLRLTGNTGISRLARSTKLSKTESRFRLSGAFSVRLESRYESSRPRNLLKISFCLRRCQSPDFTGFAQEASTWHLAISLKGPAAFASC